VRIGSVTPVKTKTLALTGVVLLVLIATAGWYLWNFQRKPAAAVANALSQAVAIAEKSIAVLPFESFSDDKENAYFADGVQDDILTDLAKVADLKVISRRSVGQYAIPRKAFAKLDRHSALPTSWKAASEKSPAKSMLPRS
jgi:hypothetical protein